MKTWERKNSGTIVWETQRSTGLSCIWTNSGGQASCPTSSAREASVPHQRKVVVFEWYTRNEICQLNLCINAYKRVQSSIGVVTDDLQSKNKNNAYLSSHTRWSVYSWSNGEEMMQQSLALAFAQRKRWRSHWLMRSKVTLESVTCDLEVRERQNSCATVSKNICEATGTSLYTPFDSWGPIHSQTKLILSHANSAVNLKKAAFVCTCWIRHNLIACRCHSPLRCERRSREPRHRKRTLQTSKQRATSPHAGMRTKRIRFRQNQHELKFHCVFP
jgi:hypothetical protein